MRLASDCMTSRPLQQGLLYDNVDSEDGGEIGMERDGCMNVPRKSAFCSGLIFDSFLLFRFLRFHFIEADGTFGRIVGGEFENWHSGCFARSRCEGKRIIHLNFDAWQPRQIYGHLILIK